MIFLIQTVCIRMRCRVTRRLIRTQSACNDTLTRLASKGLTVTSTYTSDGFSTMADGSLKKTEVRLHPLLSLCQFLCAVTAPLLVKTCVGVSQGPEPPLKMLDSLAHGFGLILPQLCLLVHFPVVSHFYVPQHCVFMNEIAHELLLIRFKSKLCLFGPLLLVVDWLRGRRGYRCSCRRCPRGVGTCTGPTRRGRGRGHATGVLHCIFLHCIFLRWGRGRLWNILLCMLTATANSFFAGVGSSLGHV